MHIVRLPGPLVSFVSVPGAEEQELRRGFGLYRTSSQALTQVWRETVRDTVRGVGCGSLRLFVFGWGLRIELLHEC